MRKGSVLGIYLTGHEGSIISVEPQNRREQNLYSLL
jgi:hypothetical protein